MCCSFDCKACREDLFFLLYLDLEAMLLVMVVRLQKLGIWVMSAAMAANLHLRS